MVNIRILETGIDVSPIKAQLRQYPEDWGAQHKLESAHNVNKEYGFPEIDVGVLQLVVGGVERVEQYVGDTEICIPTPAFNHHTAVLQTVGRYFRHISRCAFLSLPVGGHVGTHIDVGDYYLTRDRYHLAIQGKYLYHVGDEEVLIEPGMLVWFNNKLPHGTQNVGDEVRVTFVFDVKNPAYTLEK